ncbi:MAG: DUF2796 domain-containing protein [Desulfovibrio sp.]|nr:DUF2796 domain-containing protein [Desulfovibrio sp.]
MKNIVLFVAVACASAFGRPASAHEAHEHGTARLNLSVEGQRVEIKLETPLANLISFEHAPSTDAQKKEVRDMAAALHKADTLFIFPAEARCRLEKVSLESEVLSADLLAAAGASAGLAGKDAIHKGASHKDAAEKAPAGGKEEGGETHADLDAEITFLCDNSENLKRIEVRMFAQFPDLREIEVQTVTPGRQGAAELTPQSNVIGW